MGLWGCVAYDQFMRLQLDPDSDDAYRRVPLRVAEWADQVFDWLEASPVDVRARTHQFTNGLMAVTAHRDGQDWLILWEPDGDVAHVRYLGEDTLGL